MLRKEASWITRFGKIFRQRRQKRAATPARRGLRFESLERRSMLSATVLPTISGIVYQDLGSGALASNDPRVANVTINLFRDGGDGVFEGKGAGSDDALVGTTTSNANGMYSFANLNVGNYYVQEIGVPGAVIPSGSGVAQVSVTAANLQGAAQGTIDSFGSTMQNVSGSLHGGRTGTSSMTTSDAIGGHRNLYVQLTTAGGAINMGADSDWPGVLDFGANAASNGVFWVNWDGNNSNAAILNPTGLGQIDLTGQGAATGITLSAGVDHDSGQLTLKVYSDAANWSWATVSIPNTGDGSLGASAYIAFSSFTVGGGMGANFSRVGAVQLGISGLNASDGEVGPIQTVGPMVLTANIANVPQVDLSVVKSAQPSPATAGGQLTYTFTTTNNGPANATGVTLSDVLPAGVTYVSSTSSQGTVTNNNGSLTVQLGNLATSATTTTTVVVSVGAGASGSLSNTVTVTGNQPDPIPSNNTSTVTTPLVVSADLALVKTVSSASTKPGAQLTYTLTTTNLGPSNATGVTIVDTLPAGFTYSSATGDTSATISSQTLTLGVGNLAVGATATITLVGSVTSDATGTLTNSATVSGAQLDPNLSNNTSTAVTTITPVVKQAIVDLSIVKTAQPNPVSVGGTLTYTLVVTNNSLVTATGVRITDALPAGFTYTSSSGAVSASVAGSTLTLNLGTLTSQGVDTITIIGHVTSLAAATLTNTAVVSADQPDSNPLDNTSSAITTVVRPTVPTKFWFIV